MNSRIIFVLCAIGLILASCGAPSPKNTAQKRASEYTLTQLDSMGRAYTPAIGTFGGELHAALENDPNGFCPHTTNSGYSSSVLSYIYEGLVTVDPVTMEPKGSLAKSWDISPDGRTWTFHLRNDVFFSDSVKFSSDDVLFTFNDIIYNNKINATARDMLTIAGKRITLSAPDSFTAVFTLPVPFAPFLASMGLEIMPRHVYGKAAKAGTIENFMENGCRPDHVVGTGPFILDKVELGQRIVLRRNPQYWKTDAAGKRLPYLDRIVMPIIKEPNQVTMRFMRGEIDGISLLGENYPMVKPKEAELGVQIYRVGPRWYVPFFAFNQNIRSNPKTGKPYVDPVKQRWFRDPDFRKACSYAIDCNAIIAEGYNGLAYKPEGPWGKCKTPFSNPDITTYDFDTAKAKGILAAGGYRDRNGDGFLEDSTGHTVEFTITITGGVDFLKKIYEIVRKDLQNIGMKVSLNFVEFNTLIDKTDNTFDWDVVGFSRGTSTDPHFAKESWRYGSTHYFTNPGQTTPSTLWEARIAEIFEKGACEMDTANRRVLYREWQAIVQDQCVMTYLPTREVILGVNSRIGNVHLTKYLARIEDLLYNVEELYIKPLK